MNKEEEMVTYADAISQWGPQAQIKVAAEEFAELIVELMKMGRNINGSSIEKITDEMADAEVVLGQLKFMFNNAADVERTRQEKLMRVREMLK